MRKENYLEKKWGETRFYRLSDFELILFRGFLILISTLVLLKITIVEIKSVISAFTN